MTEYLEQIEKMFIHGRKVMLRRRIDRKMSIEDPEYIDGYWDDVYSGDVYKYNIYTKKARCIFSITK